MPLRWNGRVHARVRCEARGHEPSRAWVVQDARTRANESTRAPWRPRTPGGRFVICSTPRRFAAVLLLLAALAPRFSFARDFHNIQFKVPVDSGAAKEVLGVLGGSDEVMLRFSDA